MADISNEPNSVAMVIVQGSTLTFPVTITQVGTDFTTATVAGKIVNNFVSLTVLETFNVTGVSGAMDTLSFTVGLSATETAALANTTAGERSQPFGFYDIEVTLGAVITRYLQGSVTLSRQVTV